MLYVDANSSRDQADVRVGSLEVVGIGVVEIGILGCGSGVLGLVVFAFGWWDWMWEVLLA